MASVGSDKCLFSLLYVRSIGSKEGASPVLSELLRMPKCRVFHGGRGSSYFLRWIPSFIVSSPNSKVPIYMGLLAKLITRGKLDSLNKSHLEGYNVCLCVYCFLCNIRIVSYTLGSSDIATYVLSKAYFSNSLL